ncbi:MAG: glycoside hydrolase family 2 TIM barrel-domain containing protein [Sedimentisphaerales bacterium]|nr:glycoside hydrolase family 2 TIM barrel-domain containing protein [Sedimentisphaerales bacterium]
MAVVTLVGLGLAFGQTIDLSGTWRFCLDPNDVGLQRAWWLKDLPDRIQLPGALQHQGYGDPIDINTPWVARLIDRDWYKKPIYARWTRPGNVLVPFFLQPARHYVGPAWYQRDIEIPPGWPDKRVVLFLERPHWETHVWLDERPIGSNRSLATPHEYDLGLGLSAGRHRVTIRVDNRMIVDVGSDAHSISDQTQTCWNGIVGRIELKATSPVWIADVQAYPNLKNRLVDLDIELGNASRKAGKGILNINGDQSQIDWAVEGSRVRVQVPVEPQVRPWDEFNPGLFRLQLTLKGDQADDQRELMLGLRQVSTAGLRLLMNDRPFLVRGTLECCIFPLTGYPAMDVESWIRIIRRCKEFGLNHMRFHSWCPPEAAFVAADMLGFYVQVECGIWARAGARLGYGDPVDKWLYEETEAILKAYGNHPSFVFMTHGNEPTARPEFLAEWVRHFKQKDPRRLYAAATGWGQTDQDQFQPVIAVGTRNGPRVRGEQGWRGKDYSAALAVARVPVISHEIGQFCAYPDLSQIAKYTGALIPGNLMIFRELARDNGILQQNAELAHASGMLQVLCYKEEIEAALRTRDLAGFQLLDLHDFPGQGTALVGVLDAFWDPKGYIDPAGYRRFCNSTVVLARLPRRVFTTSDTLDIPLEVTHYGSGPIPGATPYWRLVDKDGNVVQGGELPARTIDLGDAISLGTIRMLLADLPVPAGYRLVAGIKGTAYENDWDIWVYPPGAEIAEPPGVIIANNVQQAIGPPGQERTAILFPEAPGKAHPKVSFMPIFWNNQMFPNPDRQTLGLLCDPNHPALSLFPTRPYSQWNWEQVLQGARAFDISAVQMLEPLVQIIDDWNTSRRLALVFECRVEGTRVLVCGARLPQMPDSPAARQFYKSLLSYVSGPAFRPKVSMGSKEFADLIGLEAYQSPASATVSED